MYSSTEDAYKEGLKFGMEEGCPIVIKTFAESHPSRPGYFFPTAGLLSDDPIYHANRYRRGAQEMRDSKKAIQESRDLAARIGEHLEGDIKTFTIDPVTKRAFNLGAARGLRAVANYRPESFDER